MPGQTAQRATPERMQARPRTPPQVPSGELSALHQVVGNQAFAASVSGGAPLDSATRAEMEAGFGRDLGHVRLHTDSAAGQSVRAAGARAYTVGRHVFLGPDGLSQGNTAARRLLAHELAHVVQQERGGAQDPAVPGAAHEEHADRAADAVLTGGTAVDVGPGTRVGLARADASQADGGGWSLVGAISQALSGRLLGAVGLPPGAGLAQSAMRGFAEELARQLFKDDTSAAALFLKRVTTMSAGDFGQFYKGYVSGLAEGVVSPVTDLVGLAAFGEQLQMLRGRLLVSVFARSQEIVDGLEKLAGRMTKLVPEWNKAWAAAKANPMATVLAVLGTGERLRAGADTMAYNLGRAGAAGLTSSLAEPFKPAPHQEKFEPSLARTLLQPATTAVSAGRALMDRIQNTPWAKVGGKFGHVVGLLAIQLVMMVFTGGLGNLLEQVAQKIGSLGAALGKLLRPVGTAVTRVAEFLGEVGRGVAMVEDLVTRVFGKVLAPLEKVLGPVLKPLSEAAQELRAFLRKLFGVAEKDGVQLLERAAGAATKTAPHPDISPTPKPAPHGTPAPARPSTPGHPYREPTPPAPEQPHFPIPEKPAKPPAPPAPEPVRVPDAPVPPEPVVHPPTRRRIDPGPYKEAPDAPPRKHPEFEIDPRFRKPLPPPRRREVPPPSPVPPEPVKTPVPPKSPEPMPKPAEPMPSKAASSGESVLAPEPPVAVPAGAEVAGPVPEPALAAAGTETEAAGAAAAPIAESGGRPPVRASAEGGDAAGGGARKTEPSVVSEGGGQPSDRGPTVTPKADILSDRLAALEEVRVSPDIRRPLAESLRRIRETAAKDPVAAGRLLDELEHVLESRGVTLPGHTLDKQTRDLLGGSRTVDDEARAAAEEIDALTAGSTPYIDRFTWQVSEEEAVLLQVEFPGLPAAGWREQPRIIKRRGESVIIEKGRTPKGATKPERYHPGTPSHPPVSLEVKNWPLDEAAVVEDRFARSDFLLKTADQAKRRAAQLPSNAEQYILIDLRGQQVDEWTRDWLARRLEQMSGGALRAERVRFLTGSAQ